MSVIESHEPIVKFLAKNIFCYKLIKIIKFKSIVTENLTQQFVALIVIILLFYLTVLQLSHCMHMHHSIKKKCRSLMDLY